MMLLAVSVEPLRSAWSRLASVNSILEKAELEARCTGSHCGGLTTAWSASASLLATQGFVVFGMKAAQKAAATPMRTSARKGELCSFACNLRIRCVCRGEVHGVAHAASRGGGEAGTSAHRRRMESRGGVRLRASQVRGGCMGYARDAHGVCMASALEVHGRCMGGA